MKKEKIPFEEVIVDDEMRDQLLAEGYSAFPVVKVDIDGEKSTWSNYRMDRIKALAEKLR